jgi:tetratricopeptide (TPR) repeat protein
MRISRTDRSGVFPPPRLPAFLLGAILLGALAATTARGQTHRRAESPHSTRWALLVGVEDYLQLEKLHYCAADMRALRDALAGCGFPERQITLLEDHAADRRYMPFKSVIEHQLDLILTMADRGDLLVVGFSGHGVHVDGKSYLCPMDARLRDVHSMICVETLYQRLAKCPATLKVVLVDACRDDPRPSGDKSIGPAPELEPLGRTLERPPEGIYCLTSCAPGETSKEDVRLGHGVFMHFVLEGLRGAADLNHRGKVSLLELCRYATMETKLYVRDKYNESQRPSYKLEATDDFDLMPSLARAKSLAAVKRGDAHWQEHQYREAAADYEEALRWDPQNANAFFGKGRYDHRRYNLQPAIAAFDRAVQLDPEQAEFHLFRAMTWEASRDKKQENSELQEVLRICGTTIGQDPKNAQTYCVRGTAYSMLGEKEKGIADCSEAIRLDPGDAKAYRFHAEANMDLGKFDEAIDDCRKGMLLDAKDGDLYLTRATAYSFNREFDKAIADCDEALRLDPNNAFARRMRDSLTESKKKPPARDP